MSKKDTLSKKPHPIKNLKRCLIKEPENERKKHLIKNLHKILKNLIMYLKKVPYQESN